MKTSTLERKTASPKPMHPTHLIRRIEKGLPFAELEALRKNLDLPLEQLASKLSISRATLHRRKTAGRLSPDEWGESTTAFIPRSLLRYTDVSRCRRFFLSRRCEEDAYHQWSVTDEQCRRDGKAAQPGGRERLGPSGGVARSSQVGANMFVARALPSRPRHSRATCLSTSTGS